jgi:MFS family permease
MTRHRGRPSVLGRLLTSYSCASVANGLPWPLLLVLVWDEYGAGPHGVWIVGLAGAARMLPYVLLSWAIGSLGDHVRRDRLVRTTLLLRLVCLTGAGLALGTDRVGWAVLAATLAVAVGTPTFPAIAASLPTVAPEQRVRATEVLVTIEVSAWVVGPALGGLLLAPVTRPWTLTIAVGLTLVALVLVADVVLPGPADRASDAVAGMLRAVAGCRPAVAALIVAGAINLALTVTGMALLPLSKDAWGRDETVFGLATACLGFGALGAPLLARLVRASVPRGLVVLGGTLFVVGVSPVPWVALVPLALGGATAVVVESQLTAQLQDAVPDRYRSGALGLADSIMVGACLVGSLMTPALVELVGPRPLVVLASGLAIVAVAAGVSIRTAVDRSGAPRTSHHAPELSTPRVGV